MTRTEHVEWCKERAREYLGQGDLGQALASMMSDLSKHPETKAIAKSPLMALGMTAVMAGDHADLTRFIEGFN